MDSITVHYLFVAVLLALLLSRTVLGAHTSHHLSITWYEYAGIKKLMGAKLMNCLKGQCVQPKLVHLPN